jgi:hypothetical protein
MSITILKKHNALAASGASGKTITGLFAYGWGG